MRTANKRSDLVAVKRYLVDAKGNKKAAILEMKELVRIEELLEDISDLKAIDKRGDEKEESYEAYSRKRKSSGHV